MKKGSGIVFPRQQIISVLHFGMTYQGCSHCFVSKRTEDRHCFRL